MTDTTTIFDVIRHGEPEGGPMYRGSKDDPLSPAGWQQMRNAITSMDRWDAIVSSPMQRCVHFAQELAERYHIPLHLDDDLREINFGEWEGRTADEVMANDGERLSQFWANPVANTPPSGEPVSDFQTRVVARWYHWQEHLAGKQVLIVCHGGIVRMIAADVLHIPLEHAFSGLSTPYACRSRIQINRSSHGRFQSLIGHGSTSNE